MLHSSLGLALVGVLLIPTVPSPGALRFRSSLDVDMPPTSFHDLEELRISLAEATAHE
jgi:hypothetical protein